MFLTLSGFSLLGISIFLSVFTSDQDSQNQSSPGDQPRAGGARGERFSSRALDARSLRSSPSGEDEVGQSKEVDFGDQYERDLESIKVLVINVNDPIEFQEFETILDRFRGYPKRFQDVLVDDLLRRQVENAFLDIDWNDPTTVRALFAGFDKVFESLEERFGGDSLIPDGYIDQFIIGAGAQSLRSDDFIRFVDNADFRGREEVYVRAYVVKITSEDSLPDLSAIPHSGDPLIDQKLHQGLFKAYAHVDQEHAIRFLSASEFEGGDDSQLARTIVGSFAVRDWETFKAIIESTENTERRKILVNFALARKEIKDDGEKRSHLIRVSK